MKNTSKKIKIKVTDENFCYFSFDKKELIKTEKMITKS